MSERSIEDEDFTFEQSGNNRDKADALRASDDEKDISISDSGSAASMRSSGISPPGRSGTGLKPDYDELAEAERDARTVPTQAAFTGVPNQPAIPLESSNAGFSDGYDPAKYANLAIDSSVKELFKYIGRYKPEKRQLPTELKPFIPDYIAAVGDVDEFLKPPRPDGRFEPLGLTVLDEPSVKQSDPAIMRKFLKAHLKGTAAVEDEDADAIQHDDEDRARKIEQWIRDVDALHEQEVAGEFKPKGRFPPYDTLLQTWPEELEPLVRSLRRPDGAVHAETDTLARAICGLLDIPVYDDIIDSLHTVFMLYLELKNNELCNRPTDDGLGMTNQLNLMSLA